MNKLEDLKKNDRDSLRLNEYVKDKIIKDHGSIPAYFEKCCVRDYKVSNGRIVKVRKLK